jgi:Cu+-exporting ATPase
MAIDPVCGMRIDEARATSKLYIVNRVYYFCSEGCEAEFQRHPEDYDEGASAGEVRERDV